MMERNSPALAKLFYKEKQDREVIFQFLCRLKEFTPSFSYLAHRTGIKAGMEKSESWWCQKCGCW